MTTENPAHATQNAESQVVETPASQPAATQEPAKATQEQGTQSTTPEVKTEPAKTEEKKPEVVVPEKYDFKIPEQSFLSQADIERISADAKEKGLSNEDAQKLLEGEHSKAQSFFDNRKAEYAKKVEGWKDSVIKDPVLGGDNFTKNAAYAERAIKKFGTPELQALMDESGFGNHPEMFRLFSKLGELSGEDTYVAPGAHSPISQEQSRLDKLYPTHKK